MSTITVTPINLTDDGYPDVITTAINCDALDADECEPG